ncbi:MAG TPA: glutamyl-tRNA reductase [Chthoniobacterales bacterium]|nr:glutamyl-tRNA reductase [Chthoniobacterales bacterium]
MKVFCVGLSHHTAKVETRERFGRTLETERLLRENGCAEALVLDTCNRVEVYAVAERELSTGEVARCVARKLDHDVTDDAATFYRYEDAECAQHLFRVASGLDSMVVGETEVLGQAKKAYEAARACGAAGPYLHRLFQRAFRVAKQVRTNTDITRGAVSVGSVAAELAGKIFGDLSKCKVLLLGTGEAGERTARALVSRGVRTLRVSNRSAERAQELASAVRATAVPFEEWMDHCRNIDILITSISTEKPLLTRDNFEPVIAQRRLTPLFIIDIAVPRNVDPAVNILEGIYLYDLDALHSVARQALEMRRQHVTAAEEIIAEHVTAFSQMLFRGLQREPSRDLHPPVGETPSVSGAV